MFVCVCLYLLLIGAQTTGANGLKFGMGGGDRPWDCLWVGVIHCGPSGGCGRQNAQKCVCVYLLPIGAQTPGPSGLKFGMDGCVIHAPLNGCVSKTNKNAVFGQKGAECGHGP